MKKQGKNQTMIDQLESHIKYQDMQIKSLMKTCSNYSDEILRLRQAITIELGLKAVEILRGEK
jgi:hypothetical protein